MSPSEQSNYNVCVCGWYGSYPDIKDTRAAKNWSLKNKQFFSCGLY